MLLGTIANGRLGKDPEMRALPDGTQVCELSVAVSGRKGRDGEEKTTWVRVSVFGRQADNCCQYLAKGQLVSCYGEMELEEWQARDGSAGKTLKMRADRVEFGAKPAGNDASNGSRAQRPQAQPQPRGAASQQYQDRQARPAYDSPRHDGGNDELPF